ncbi:MAG: HAMP domain-containing histidine kinase [Ardenticatenaceae bacterium]|nr:HAMP domain-containing histidine kinase [Ardenticatenaceae bacterium]MCB9446646.1 HAMP domain-containing histidine kinase [Ardenticatenaceae bacterium]
MYLLIVPPVVFLILRLSPVWDWLVWDTIWYGQLIYFYLTAFISFMALVGGVFVNAALIKTNRPRTMFTSLAFVTLAMFSLLASITTPSTLYTGIGSEPMRWAARTALFLSATYFALAMVRWDVKWQMRLVNGRFLFWSISLALFILMGWTFFFRQELFNQISSYDPLLQYLIATAATIMFLFAGQRSWKIYTEDNNPFEKALAVTLLLLAEAQISQTLGTWGHLSWFLHSLIILLALSAALFAFLRAFNSLRDLQPARYFALLGSISIVGLALISGELVRLLVSGANRRFVVGLTLTQSTVSFVIMYIIVLSLDRLIKERTEALKREQKLRNELTRLIVHDLKNPLMVMTQGSNLLSRGRLGELTPEQKKLSDRIQQAGEKTLHLIDDILAVEKMESEAVHLQRVPVDLWQVLRETVASLQVLAQSNQQTLTLRLSSRLPIIEADESLLRRVMDNIIANALKFTPENGRIAVTALSDSSHLVIEVADSGPGVPPTYREHIFEKFSQVHTTERRGVGLGLTFCKMVIEAHHGTIVVEDSELGGALFKITLPMHTDPLFVEEPDTTDSRKKIRIRPSLYTTLMNHL